MSLESLVRVPECVVDSALGMNELELVALTFARWNQIDDLLRRLEELRSAAGSA